MGTLEWRAKKCKQIKHKTHRLDKAIYRSLQSQTPVVTGAKFPQKILFSFNFANNGQNTKAGRWWVVRNTGGRLTGQWKMWIPCYTWTSRADWLQVVAAPGLASGIFEQFGSRRNSQVWQPLGNPEEGTTDHLPPPRASKCHPLFGTDSLLEFLFAMLSLVFTNTQIQIHIMEWVHVPPPAMLSIVFASSDFMSQLSPLLLNSPDLAASPCNLHKESHFKKSHEESYFEE